MIRGYHYFRKHPYFTFIFECFTNRRDVHSLYISETLLHYTYCNCETISLALFLFWKLQAAMNLKQIGCEKMFYLVASNVFFSASKGYSLIKHEHGNEAWTFEYIHIFTLYYIKSYSSIIYDVTSSYVLVDWNKIYYNISYSIKLNPIILYDILFYQIVLYHMCFYYMISNSIVWYHIILCDIEIFYITFPKKSWYSILSC